MMTRLCAEAGFCPVDPWICSEFENEPSEIVETGRILGTGYCMRCGHSWECHVELTQEELNKFVNWED